MRSVLLWCDGVVLGHMDVLWDYGMRQAPGSARRLWAFALWHWWIEHVCLLDVPEDFCITTLTIE